MISFTALSSLRCFKVGLSTGLGQPNEIRGVPRCLYWHILFGIYADVFIISC